MEHSLDFVTESIGENDPGPQSGTGRPSYVSQPTRARRDNNRRCKPGGGVARLPFNSASRRRATGSRRTHESPVSFAMSIVAPSLRRIDQAESALAAM